MMPRKRSAPIIRSLLSGCFGCVWGKGVGGGVLATGAGGIGGNEGVTVSVCEDVFG